ncbi:hypothetical protein LXL04_027711 [Taraxacum kok-saghyz]
MLGTGGPCYEKISVVVPEWCKTEIQNRDRGRVLILTQNFNIINETVEVIIDNLKYKVMVAEDFKESEKLGPRVVQQTENQEEEENAGVNLMVSDHSLCDENSNFESDGDFNFEFNLDDGAEPTAGTATGNEEDDGAGIENTAASHRRRQPRQQQETLPEMRRTMAPLVSCAWDFQNKATHAGGKEIPIVGNSCGSRFHNSKDSSRSCTVTQTRPAEKNQSSHLGPINPSSPIHLVHGIIPESVPLHPTFSRNLHSQHVSTQKDSPSPHHKNSQIKETLIKKKQTQQLNWKKTRSTPPLDTGKIKQTD